MRNTTKIRLYGVTNGDISKLSSYKKIDEFSTPVKYGYAIEKNNKINFESFESVYKTFLYSVKRVIKEERKNGNTPHILFEYPKDSPLANIYFNLTKRHQIQLEELLQ